MAHLYVTGIIGPSNWLKEITFTILKINFQKKNDYTAEKLSINILLI